MKRLLSILLVLLLLVPYTTVKADEGSDFDEFMMEEFKEIIGSDYTSLHFAMKDYESLGIEKPELTIGSVSWDDYADDLEGTKDTLSNLESFDYAKLNDYQKVDYDTYKFYLERMIELNQYPYHDFYFWPNGGLHDNIITTFTEFVFYKKEDIGDYIAVLDTVDEFLDECIEITDKQVKEGYFMPDGALDSTLEAINKFTEKKDDNQLIVIFDKNVDAFEGLSDQERKEYKEKNKAAVLNSVIPAYEKLAKQLESYRGSRKYGNSVYDLPDGKEYYESFVKFKSSTDATPEELLDIMNDVLDTEIRHLYEIIFNIKDDGEDINISDPTEMIEYHRANLGEFPEGPEVTYTATYLDPSVANEGILAYYMEPPLDDIKDNVIKINPDGADTNADLYATLAHEGFPGHLYQITWYLNTKPNMLRTQINTIGYTEGWGMYAENSMFKYMPTDESLAEYNRLNTSLGYIMNAACDVGVNGLGWDVNEVKEYLEGLGLNGEMAQDLYDFVCEAPGVIVPYGAGLAQFLRLREKAEYEMGDNFNVKDFNNVLLTYGDRPFEIVEKNVNDYIETGRVNEPKDPYSDIENPPLNDYIVESGFWKYALIPLGFLGVALIAFIASRFAKRKDPFSL